MAAVDVVIARLRRGIRIERLVNSIKQYIKVLQQEVKLPLIDAPALVAIHEAMDEVTTKPLKEKFSAFIALTKPRQSASRVSNRPMQAIKLCRSPLIKDLISDMNELIALLWKLAPPEVRTQISLHEAAANGFVSLVELLIKEEKVDVNTRDASGENAIHYAIVHGWEQVVSYLLEQQAEVDPKDTYWISIPFRNAVRENDKKCVKVLCSYVSTRELNMSASFSMVDLLKAEAQQKESSKGRDSIVSEKGRGSDSTDSESGSDSTDSESGSDSTDSESGSDSTESESESGSERESGSDSTESESGSERESGSDSTESGSERESGSESESEGSNSTDTPFGGHLQDPEIPPSEVNPNWKFSFLSAVVQKMEEYGPSIAIGALVLLAVVGATFVTCGAVPAVAVGVGAAAALTITIMGGGAYTFFAHIAKEESSARDCLKVWIGCPG